MTTASMLTSVHQGKQPAMRISITPTMIGNIFNLLDNVKYLTVIPASRSSLARFPPPFADGSAPIDGPGKEQLFRTMRPVEEPVLDILEGWLGSSPSRPPVRNLRTTVHLAKTFLSSVSPTHTLVLIDGDSNGGNIAVGDRLRDTRSPVQILQTESYYTLTSMMTDIWRSGPCPNLKIMVDVSHGQEGWGPLYNDKYPLRGLCRAFRMHPSIHTCVLRTVLYSRSLWEGSDIPRAFELDLSSRMAKLEGRSPPPRVIVELGTLGKPDFICWIFTMVSKDRWTRQKEEHPILDLMEREDLLYLSAGAQGGPADPALWDREDEHIVFSDDEDSDDGWW
ncbi:hypothetical protein DL93DRAFT_2078069 [Clavulina sp. PMI_390]|nr:hypothetical protein DL93DRAFT_2078069 [Clavulina sp. PMI_390]